MLHFGVPYTLIGIKGFIRISHEMHDLPISSKVKAEGANSLIL